MLVCSSRPRMFSQRLQRPPPMAWDLEYVPSDEDEPSMHSSVSSRDGSQSSTDELLSDMDIKVCRSPSCASEAPTGFRLTLNAESAGCLGEAIGEAEQMAQCLLRLGSASERLLQQHFELLPYKPHNRFGSNDSFGHRAASITFGAFVHGGIYGCHKATASHPWSCLLWTAVIRTVDSSQHFTSVALAKNTVSNLHSDLNNHPQVCNLVVSVCTETCRGGAIWVSDSKGDRVLPGAGRGRDLELSAEGVKFCARNPHFTYPFEGTRFVAVAFHVRDSWKLPKADTQRILALNFHSLEVSPTVTDPYLPACD